MMIYSRMVSDVTPMARQNALQQRALLAMPMKPIQVKTDPSSINPLKWPRPRSTSESIAIGIERDRPTVTTVGDVSNVARARSMLASIVPKSALQMIKVKASGEGRLKRSR